MSDLLPLHIAWTDETGARVYRGADWKAGSWILEDLTEGVVAPSSSTGHYTVALQNVAQERQLEARARDGASRQGALEKLVNVRLYLDADDEAVVDALVNVWPAAGAGVELSFDNGATWRAISPEWGNPRDSSTWIDLPASALPVGGVAGELAAFPPWNRATLQVRVKTPAKPSRLGLFRFRLEVDCDVL